MDRDSKAAHKAKEFEEGRASRINEHEEQVSKKQDKRKKKKEREKANKKAKIEEQKKAKRGEDGVTEEKAPEYTVFCQLGTYYKQIAGVKYDKGLLDLAESLTTGRGDGRISRDDALKLWEDALDGKGVTECECRTLQYVLEKFNCTDSGRALLEEKLKEHNTELKKA